MNTAHASNPEMAAATHSFRVLVIGGGVSLLFDEIAYI
jgi:hypothetical protein